MLVLRGPTLYWTGGTLKMARSILGFGDHGENGGGEVFLSQNRIRGTWLVIAVVGILRRSLDGRDRPRGDELVSAFRGRDAGRAR